MQFTFMQYIVRFANEKPARNIDHGYSLEAVLKNLSDAVLTKLTISVLQLKKKY